VKETGKTSRMSTADHSAYEKILGIFPSIKREMITPMATKDAVMLMLRTVVKITCNVFI